MCLGLGSMWLCVQLCLGPCSLTQSFHLTLDPASLCARPLRSLKKRVGDMGGRGGPKMNPQTGLEVCSHHM